MSEEWTQERLEDLCREWQKVLRLQDWDIKTKLVNPEDIDGNRAQVRRPTPNKRAAALFLANPANFQEQVDDPDGEVSIVHELLHLHLWEMSDAMESLSKELGSVAAAAVSMAQRQHDQAEERAVHKLAYVLVGLKRQGGAA